VCKICHDGHITEKGGVENDLNNFQLRSLPFPPSLLILFELHDEAFVIWNWTAIEENLKSLEFRIFLWPYFCHRCFRYKCIEEYFGLEKKNGKKVKQTNKQPNHVTNSFLVSYFTLSIVTIMKSSQYLWTFSVSLVLHWTFTYPLAVGWNFMLMSSHTMYIIFCANKIGTFR
jgi:hypothetical protein